MRYKTVIFDLDGTLLDTLGDLRDSLNFTLQKHGFPCRKTEEVRAFVGNGLRRLVERAVPSGTSEEEIAGCLTDFKVYYKTHANVLTKPYDGIRELLLSLREGGVSLAVVSNKADYAVKELVAGYFPDTFSCAYGEREGISRKPAPDAVFSAMRDLHATPGETVYIGDSEVDVETARNAGVDCIAVTWGFRDRRLLEELSPQYLADQPSAVKSIVMNATAAD